MAILTVALADALIAEQGLDVVIPPTYTWINQYAFFNNELTSVEIPDSVTTIGEYAFYNNDLTSVDIGDSVITISDYSFYNNYLTSVEIPDSVTTIGRSAFYNNDLTSIHVGDSVTTIGDGAFSENNSLATISIHRPSSLDLSEYEDVGVEIIRYPGVSIAQSETTDGDDLLTSEDEDFSTFTVVLTDEPTDDVTISITGLDATENSLSSDILYFTTTDWDTPQTITVTGVDDTLVDGNNTTTLTAIASNTGGYAVTESDTTTVKNTDNDDSFEPTEITGSSSDDFLQGAGNRDVIKDGSGNDHLKAKDNNDILVGGSGNDSLYGGKHIDELFGGSGDDILGGGKGGDILTGGSDADTFQISQGNDVIRDFSIAQQDRIGSNGYNLELTQDGSNLLITNVDNNVMTTVLNVNRNDLLAWQPLLLD